MCIIEILGNGKLKNLMDVDRFISHRGANTDFVENTIEAFQIAKDYGFKWFEIDIQMSSDGEIFLFHDTTPKRLALCDKNVTDMTISELKNLKLTHPILKSSCKIPTFKEYLDWAEREGVFTNVEFKITKECKSYKESIVSKTLELLKKYPNQRDKILLSSFSKTIMNVLEQDSLYKKGKLYEVVDWEKEFDYIDNELAGYFIDNEYVAIIVNYECLNRDRVKYLKEKFGKLFVYSVYTDFEVKKLLSWDADAMFIDKKEQIHLSVA